MYDVRDRVVLITGAARGLGEGLARALAAKGARLALVGLEPERLEPLGRELGGWWREVDVADRGQVDAAVAAAAAHHGGIDVAVANAGVISFGTVAEQDPDAFERVIRVNLLGTYYTMRATVPHVVGRRGYLLALASLATAFQAPAQAQYSASKAGVLALANSLRQELHGTGVRVGTAHPTFVSTDMVRTHTQGDPIGARLWRGNTGLWKAIEPEEAVAGLVSMVERRARLAVFPRRLTPLVLAPGLVQPVIERLLRR